MHESEGQIPEEETKPYRHFERAIQEDDVSSDGENIKEVRKRLNIPDPNAEYGEILDEHGEVKEKTLTLKSDTHSLDLRFSLIPNNSENQKIVEDYIDPRHGKVLPEFQDVHKWHEVVDLELAGPDGQKINISNIMPERYHVFFIDSAEEQNGVVVEMDKSIFLIGGSFAAPTRLITLLHEIGHTWDTKNIEEGKIQPIPKGKDSDLAEMLRGERAATAFELKIVRSVTSPGDQLRKDALDNAKYHDLESYHSYIRKEIENGAIMDEVYEDYAKFLSEMTEEEEIEFQMWNEFNEWRMTEDYVRWITSDENRTLEMVEEFPAWKKWCEANGTAWWLEKNTTPSDKV